MFLGPLRYLDGHLLWLQDSNTTVIGDKKCKNTAVISEGALSNLNTVHVFDPNVHTIPGQFYSAYNLAHYPPNNSLLIYLEVLCGLFPDRSSQI